MLDSTQNIQVFQYTPSSILVQFTTEINENLLQFMLNFKQLIQQKRSQQLHQVINTYNSLLITYKSTISNFYTEKQALLHLATQVEITRFKSGPLKQIPVCYDTELGWDLEVVSKTLKLSISEIIQKHSQPIYTVYFIGFLPGFPYVSGLDSSLYHRRKAQPRDKIPKGSVGLADTQTGIYPVDSPGGWQIIGRSPQPLFEIQNNIPMAFLKAGDRIQFQPISKAEFSQIEAEHASHTNSL